MAKSKKSKNYKKFKKLKTWQKVVCILLALVVCAVFIYLNRETIKRYINDWKNGGAAIVTDDLSIHFLELGNEYAGDCTLIKVGNTEVLIDAGSRKGSAATIVPYVQQYCTDGVLEYVIATHAHQDHIAGFVGATKAKGVLESFVCETIIDYTLSNSDSAIREDYEALRDAEVAAGAKHYTVLECWNNENGASRSYTLAEGITMNFLFFRPAELLGEVLTCSLCRDTAEVARGDFPLDAVTDFGIGITLQDSVDNDLVAVFREMVNHFQHCPCLDPAGRRIDFDFQFTGWVNTFFGSGKDRIFQSFDNTFPADAPVLTEIFNNCQQFVTHFPLKLLRFIISRD